MSSSDRYAMTGPEGEFEPGSDGRVLRNLLGITDPDEMEEVESVALVVISVRLLTSDIAHRRFTANDVRFLHREWLGEIYAWAGEYRSVNVSKQGFPFAAAHVIPQLMTALELGPLKEYTPCTFPGMKEVARALAVTHAELILIHPFREGNGRSARLLSQAMAFQAGYMGLDFGPFDADMAEYISGIHSALDRDYSRLEAMFMRILERNQIDSL